MTSKQLFDESFAMIEDLKARNAAYEAKMKADAISPVTAVLISLMPGVVMMAIIFFTLVR